MNQQVSKSGPHRWQPGESGNRAGRPVGSRQKIAERVLAGFSDLLDTDEATTSLQRLMVDDPGKFWTIAGRAASEGNDAFDPTGHYPSRH